MLSDNPPTSVAPVKVTKFPTVNPCDVWATDIVALPAVAVIGFVPSVGVESAEFYAIQSLFHVV